MCDTTLFLYDSSDHCASLVFNSLSCLSVYCMIMNNQDGQTALLYAASKGFTEIVKLLLEKGAKVNVFDKVSHCMCVCCITDCSTKQVIDHAMLCCASNA